MTLSRDSLGGQNSHRRVSGARSSRALSTTFCKLRKLDREIGAIDRHIRMYGMHWILEFNTKVCAKRAKLDTRRKELRLLRKQYQVS